MKSSKDRLYDRSNLPQFLAILARQLHRSDPTPEILRIHLANVQ